MGSHTIPFMIYPPPDPLIICGLRLIDVCHHSSPRLTSDKSSRSQYSNVSAPLLSWAVPLRAVLDVPWHKGTRYFLGCWWEVVFFYQQWLASQGPELRKPPNLVKSLCMCLFAPTLDARSSRDLTLSHPSCSHWLWISQCVRLWGQDPTMGRHSDRLH